MEKSVNALPAGYRLALDVDPEKKGSLLLLLNILALVLTLPVVAVAFIAYYPVAPLDVLWMLLATMATMAAHELVHGLAYRHYCHKKVTYRFHGWALSASVKGTYFAKDAYIVVGLAPAVVLNVVLFLVWLAVPADLKFVFLMALGLHFGGCAGDFYIIGRILRYPPETYVEDLGTAMRFYVPGDELPQP
jgi:hypothetical protein